MSDDVTETTTGGCSCGCGTVTSVTSADEACGCGCDCCEPTQLSREEEIVQLRQLRDSASKRLEELGAT